MSFFFAWNVCVCVDLFVFVFSCFPDFKMFTRSLVVKDDGWIVPHFAIYIPLMFRFTITIKWFNALMSHAKYIDFTCQKHSQSNCNMCPSIYKHNPISNHRSWWLSLWWLSFIFQMFFVFFPHIGLKSHWKSHKLYFDKLRCDWTLPWKKLKNKTCDF